jgi:hypothetical protein
LEATPIQAHYVRVGQSLNWLIAGNKMGIGTERKQIVMHGPCDVYNSSA